MLLGGLSRAQLDENRRALAALPEGAELLDPPTVLEPARFRMLATASTWGMLAFEASVALLCLLPETNRRRLVRHALIVGFCLITYAFAPVAGFGWLLLVMGLAQCRPDERSLRVVYVCAFFLILFYTEVPWAGLIVDWVANAGT
jgi:hypothetical protein